jgi:hypothetical protein
MDTTTDHVALWKVFVYAEQSVGLLDNYLPPYFRQGYFFLDFFNTNNLIHGRSISYFWM